MKKVFWPIITCWILVWRIAGASTTTSTNFWICPESMIRIQYSVPEITTSSACGVLAILPTMARLQELGVASKWDQQHVLVYAVLDGVRKIIEHTPPYDYHDVSFSGLAIGWYAQPECNTYEVYLLPRDSESSILWDKARGLFEPIFGISQPIDTPFWSTPVICDVDNDGVVDVITTAYDESRSLYWSRNFGTVAEWNLSPMRRLALRVPSASGDVAYSMSRVHAFSRVVSPRTSEIDFSLGLVAKGGEIDAVEVKGGAVELSRLDARSPALRWIEWGKGIQVRLSMQLIQNCYELCWETHKGEKIPLRKVDGTSIKLIDRPSLAGWDLYDMDGDGHRDIILGSHNGFINLILTSGNSDEYGLPIIKSIDHMRSPFSPLTGGSIVVATAGDLNGDGLKDIVMGTEYGRVLFFPQINGSRPLTFGRGQLVHAGGKEIQFFGSGKQKDDDFWGYAQPDLRDLNGDRLLDLVVSNAKGQLLYAFNKGTGKDFLFSGLQSFYFSDGQALTTPWRIRSAFADWDGDGKTDLITASLDGRISWCSGTDNPTMFACPKPFMQELGHHPIYSAIGNGFGRSKLLVTDWTGDGVLDILVANPGGFILCYAGRQGHHDVLEPPQSIKLFDRAVHLGSGHSLAPCQLDLDSDGQDDWLVGTEAGRVRFVSSVTLRNSKEASFQSLDVYRDGYVEKHTRFDTRTQCSPLPITINLVMSRAIDGSRNDWCHYDLQWPVYGDYITAWFNFANRLNIITTVDELRYVLSQPSRGQVLVFGYHALRNDTAVGPWLSENVAELGRWVDAGGSIIASAGRDREELMLWEIIGERGAGVVKPMGVADRILIGEKTFIIDSWDRTFVECYFDVPGRIDCDVQARAINGYPVSIFLRHGLGNLFFYTPEFNNPINFVPEDDGFINEELHNYWYEMCKIIAKQESLKQPDSFTSTSTSLTCEDLCRSQKGSDKGSHLTKISPIKGIIQ